LINVDSKEVIESNFVSDVKSCSFDFVQDEVKFVGVRTGQDTVVSIDCVHCISFVEYTFVMLGDFEANGEQFVTKVPVRNFGVPFWKISTHDFLNVKHQFTV
jgi:hypothetical protein